MSEVTVTLQPVAIRQFTPEGEWVYSPSKHKRRKTIPYTDFLARYADHPTPLLYNPDPEPTGDLLAKAEPVIAYGFILDGWYVVVWDTAQSAFGTIHFNQGMVEIRNDNHWLIGAFATSDFFRLDKQANIIFVRGLFL